MNTAFLLMAQYDGAAVIPLATVCRDYFSHLTPKNLEQKVLAGKIALPIVRIDDSERTAKGVHLIDLARWIDGRTKTARRECQQLGGLGGCSRA